MNKCDFQFYIRKFFLLMLCPGFLACTSTFKSPVFTPDNTANKISQRDSIPVSDLDAIPAVDVSLVSLVELDYDSLSDFSRQIFLDSLFSEAALEDTATLDNMMNQLPDFDSAYIALTAAFLSMSDTTMDALKTTLEDSVIRLDAQQFLYLQDSSKVLTSLISDTSSHVDLKFKPVKDSVYVLEYQFSQAQNLKLKSLEDSLNALREFVYRTDTIYLKNGNDSLIKAVQGGNSRMAIRNIVNQSDSIKTVYRYKDSVFLQQNVVSAPLKMQDTVWFKAIQADNAATAIRDSATLNLWLQMKATLAAMEQSGNTSKLTTANQSVKTNDSLLLVTKTLLSQINNEKPMSRKEFTRAMRLQQPVILPVVISGNHHDKNPPKDSLSQQTGAQPKDKVVKKDASAPPTLAAVVVKPVTSKLDTIPLKDSAQISELNHPDDSLMKVVEEKPLKKDTIFDNIQQLKKGQDSLFLMLDKISGQLTKLSNPPPVVVEKVAPQVKTDTLGLLLEQVPIKVFFGVGQSTLPSSYKNSLDKIAQQLKQYKTLNIELKGFADPSGNTAANLLLSEKRAKAVKNYFVIVHKIAPDRIVILPAGEEKESTDMHYSRRVEVKLTASE